MKNFWPGKLTIIFNASTLLPAHLKNNDNTVAIRMPNNKHTLELLNFCQVPLLSTSANISGEITPNNIEEIKIKFGDKVNFYLEADNDQNSENSTIVKVTDNKVTILREGAIKKQDIQKVIGEKNVNNL